MQIVETSSWWVRSARISLANATTGKTVTLFPMIHIGEAEFYDRVYADALAHDVVLVEGLDSPITTRITRSYRWLVTGDRLQLILQPQKLKLASSSKPVIHADLSHDEFVVHWKKLPLWMRLAMYIAAPVYGLLGRLKASRAGLASRMAFDDLTSRDELLSWRPETGMLDHAIIASRDERLIEKLDLALGDKAHQRIAVVYGARHMRAVLRHLIGQRDFQVGEMDWMVVFAL